MTKLIHTADWHLGRSFHSIRKDESRHRLRRSRFEVVARIGEVARREEVRFIAVAGDLFDSPSPTRETVAEALAVIGALELPVHVIPGNHDHGGPAGPWKADHFLRERDRLAPNLVVHDVGAPVEVEGVLLLPAPLRRRQESGDPTAWVRDFVPETHASELPRVVLAHGSTTSFSGGADPNDLLAGFPNLISLERLPMAELDYVALGDWHGTRQVGEKAWYSGTPEPDRFPRGPDYASGQVLVVEPRRGGAPRVKPVPTGMTHWQEAELTVSGHEGAGDLLQEVEAITGHRVKHDVLRLSVVGSLGLADHNRIGERLLDLEARLLELDLNLEALHIRPTEDELAELSQRTGDPFVAQVADTLLSKMEGGQSAEAELALQRLHAFVTEEA